MRILLVKLTSMGDCIQALPAVSDLAAHLPEARIDWLIDENFAEIPAWHPAVNQVFCTAHRRWKSRPLQRRTWSEVGRLRTALREQPYDYIVDLQTNCKSALFGALARGPRYGPDGASASESIARLAFARHYRVVKDQLAINRWRQILARVFGYQPVPDYNFGLAERVWPASPHQPNNPYLLLVTNASWPTKQLPTASWVATARLAAAAGLQCLLPWGTKAEQATAAAIAAQCTSATLLPRLGLSEIAALLAASNGAICNDTGLAHLAAALGRPTLTCYGPTNPALIAATGEMAGQLQPQGYACVPCHKRSCVHNPGQPTRAACLASLSPGQIWQAFVQLQPGTATTHSAGTQ